MTENGKLARDSQGLESWGAPQFTVGYIDEVNGAGAVEMPGFVPTRHELVELVKYWASTAIDIEFDWFVTTAVGSSDRRLHTFAQRRVETIAQSLGEADTKAIIDQTQHEYGEGMMSEPGTSFGTEPMNNGTLSRRSSSARYPAVRPKHLSANRRPLQILASSPSGLMWDVVQRVPVLSKSKMDGPER